VGGNFPTRIRPAATRAGDEHAVHELDDTRQDEKDEEGVDEF
jgi:hypothetical protein